MSEAIAARIPDALTEQFRAAYKQTARGIVRMSEVAAKVRDEFGYPAYVAWLTDEFKLSESMADRLLRVHKQLVSTFKLTVDAIEQIAPSALYLLSSADTPEEIRDHFIEQAKQGKPVTHRDVKAATTRQPEAPASSKSIPNGDIAEWNKNDRAASPAPPEPPPAPAPPAMDWHASNGIDAVAAFRGTLRTFAAEVLGAARMWNRIKRAEAVRLLKLIHADLCEFIVKVESPDDDAPTPRPSAARRDAA